MLKKGTSASPAMAFAKSVLPQTGGRQAARREECVRRAAGIFWDF